MGSDPPHGSPTLTIEVLTKEAHRASIQADHDRGHFDKINEVFEDHAARIDTQAKSISEVTLASAVEVTVHARFMQQQALMQKMDEKIEKNAQLAVSNDATLKAGLQALEAITNSQGVAIPELRRDVQRTVTDISTVMSQVQQTAATGGTYVPPAVVDSGMAESLRTAHVGIGNMGQRMSDLQKRCDESIATLSSQIQHTISGDIQVRIAELVAHMGDFGSRITAMERAGPAAPAPTGSVGCPPGGSEAI